MSEQCLNQTVCWISSLSFSQTVSLQKFPTLPICDICLPASRQRQFNPVLFLCHFKQLFSKGVSLMQFHDFLDKSFIGPPWLQVKNKACCYTSWKLFLSQCAFTPIHQMYRDLDRHPVSQSYPCLLLIPSFCSMSPSSSPILPVFIKLMPRYPFLLILLSSPSSPWWPQLLNRLGCTSTDLFP